MIIGRLQRAHMWRLVVLLSVSVLCMSLHGTVSAANAASADKSDKLDKFENGLDSEWLDMFRQCCVSPGSEGISDHDAHQRRDISRCVGRVISKRLGADVDDDDDGDDDEVHHDRAEGEHGQVDEVAVKDTDSAPAAPMQKLKKIGIITYHSDRSSQYSPYTSFVNEFYAAVNGYPFHIFNTDRSDFDYVDPRWNKIRILASALHPRTGWVERQRLDYVVFVDEDVIFLNTSFVIEDLIQAHPQAHLFLSSNHDPLVHGHHSSGMMILKNSKFTRSFLDRWWGYEDEDLESHKHFHQSLVNTNLLHFGEQAQLTELVREYTSAGAKDKEKVVVLPPNVLNSALPAYVHQQPTDGVLNLRGDVPTMRKVSFATAFGEVCRAATHVSKETNGNQKKSGNKKSNAKNKNKNKKARQSMSITQQLEWHLSKSPSSHPQLRLSQLDLLDLALMSYEQEVNGQMKEHAHSLIEDKLFTANFGYQLDKYYQNFVAAVMAKHAHYQDFKNFTMFVDRGKNNSSNSSESNPTSQSDMPQQQQLKLFAKYTEAFADSLRLDNFHIFQSYVANNREANQLAMSRSKQKIGLKEWPTILSRAIDVGVRTVHELTTTDDSTRLEIGDECKKYIRELETIVNPSYLEVLRSQEIQLLTYMAEVRMGVSSATIGDNDHQKHSQKKAQKYSPRLSDEEMLKPGRDEAEYRSAQLLLENALAVCNKQSSPISCFLYPLYLLGQAHNGQQAWTKAIGIFDECGSNVYRTQIGQLDAPNEYDYSKIIPQVDEAGNIDVEVNVLLVKFMMGRAFAFSMLGDITAGQRDMNAAIKFVRKGMTTGKSGAGAGTRTQLQILQETLDHLKAKVKKAIVVSAERTGDAERIRKEKERKRQQAEQEQPIDLFGQSEDKEKPLVLRPDWQLDDEDIFEDLEEDFEEEDEEE
jgi:hypothetical protein